MTASKRLVVDLPQRDVDKLDQMVADTELNRTIVTRKALTILSLVLAAQAEGKDVYIGKERLLIL